LQSVVDAAEQKWQFDAQLGKATADAVEMKAAYDKVNESLTAEYVPVAHHSL
jgi:hypothetical protein